MADWLEGVAPRAGRLFGISAFLFFLFMGAGIYENPDPRILLVVLRALAWASALFYLVFLGGFVRLGLRLESRLLTVPACLLILAVLSFAAIGPPSSHRLGPDGNPTSLLYSASLAGLGFALFRSRVELGRRAGFAGAFVTLVGVLGVAAGPIIPYVLFIPLHITMVRVLGDGGGRIAIRDRHRAAGFALKST